MMLMTCYCWEDATGKSDIANVFESKIAQCHVILEHLLQDTTVISCQMVAETSELHCSTVSTVGQPWTPHLSLMLLHQLSHNA